MVRDGPLTQLALILSRSRDGSPKTGDWEARDVEENPFIRRTCAHKSKMHTLASAAANEVLGSRRGTEYTL